MKTATKKITSVLFILLGLAPLLFIIITTIRQQEIRRHMNQQLEEKMLHTVTIAKNEVIWMKEGKEILINGRMFDVKSFKPLADNKISFKGLFDDEETALVNAVQKNQQNQNNNSSKTLVKLLQLFQSSLADSPLHGYYPVFDHNYFPGLKQEVVAAFITVLSPPPQVS